MRCRSYDGEADVARLQRFNVETIAATGGCVYLHPGDIAHQLFYGNRHFDPADLTTIWEDESGVAAWVLAHPTYRTYDIQVRHDLRGGAFEREVSEFADARIVGAMDPASLGDIPAGGEVNLIFTATFDSPTHAATSIGGAIESAGTTCTIERTGGEATRVGD